MCGGSATSDDGAPVTHVQCSVEKVLNKHFRLLDYDEKLQIVEEGKPTPGLPNLTVEVKNKKLFTRKFKVQNYTTYSWLTGCSSKNKLFCWPCLLFPHGKSVWNHRGYSDLNNLSTSIKVHVRSTAHLNASLELHSFAKNTRHAGFTRRERADTQHHYKKVQKNREILNRLIEAVLNLANQDLAFQGHDESQESLNRDNYIELLKLIAKYDNELREHLSSSSTFKETTSSHIQNDIIEAIAKVLLGEQEKDVQEATFVSILLGESSDGAKHSQLSTVLRYCHKGEVKETFRGFTDISADRSAHALHGHVKLQVDDLQCKDKLVAQGYDGTAVMASNINGLQAKLKEDYPAAQIIHCCAQVQKSVVVSDLSKSIPACRAFFMTLQGFAAFFSASERNELLERIMKKKFPQFSLVQWCFKSELINTVHDNREELIYLFETMLDPTDEDQCEFTSQDVCAAKGFLSFLKEFEFNYFLEVFSIIFDHTDALHDVLQKKGLDRDLCLTHLKETIEFLKSNGDRGFNYTYYSLVKKFGLPKLRRVHDYYSHFESLYQEIYNTILSQIKIRHPKVPNLRCVELLDHRKFLSYSISGNFPLEAMKSMKETHRNSIDYKKLVNELLVIYSSTSFQCKTVPEIYDLVSEQLSSIFCEVRKLCELILTLPSTTVTVEKTFSALNRIMDYLRTSMGQDRLSRLVLLSIERAKLNEIKQRPEFYDLVIKEYITEDHRMDFHYRT